MINRGYAAIAAGVIALVIAAAPTQAQQTGVRVPRAVLEQYVGEYLYPEGSSLHISLSGDTLFRDDPGRRTVMIPLSESVFRLGGSLTIEFVTDKSYGTTIILGNGANMEFRLPRKGTRPVPAPRPKAVHVARSVLERYVGEYEYIPGQMTRTDLRVFIKLVGDGLTQTLDNNPDVALIPLSETRFAVSGTALITEFVIDDNGVTQVMGGGDRVMLARLKPKQ
jgi:hypothetical protein